MPLPGRSWMAVTVTGMPSTTVANGRARRASMTAWKAASCSCVHYPTGPRGAEPHAMPQQPPAQPAPSAHVTAAEAASSAAREAADSSSPASRSSRASRSPRSDKTVPKRSIASREVVQQCGVHDCAGQRGGAATSVPDRAADGCGQHGQSGRGPTGVFRHDPERSHAVRMTTPLGEGSPFGRHGMSGRRWLGWPQWLARRAAV